jgi:hypothetical protein
MRPNTGAHLLFTSVAVSNPPWLPRATRAQKHTCAGVHACAHPFLLASVWVVSCALRRSPVRSFARVLTLLRINMIAITRDVCFSSSPVRSFARILICLRITSTAITCDVCLSGMSSPCLAGHLTHTHEPSPRRQAELRRGRCGPALPRPEAQRLCVTSMHDTRAMRVPLEHLH